MAFPLGLRWLNNFLSLGVEKTVFSDIQGKAHTVACSVLKCMGYLGHNELSAVALASKEVIEVKPGTEGKARL